VCEEDKKQDENIFQQVAGQGVGVELNFHGEWNKYTAEEIADLKPYRISKAMGNYFYLSCNSHVLKR